jgi:hypothetical protein
MWKRISRSAPGRSIPAISVGGDWYAQLSVNSARKKIAPSRCSFSNAASSVAATRSSRSALVMVFRQASAVVRSWALESRGVSIEW